MRNRVAHRPFSSAARWCVALATIPLGFGASAQQLPFGDIAPGIAIPGFACAGTARDEAARRRCRVDDARLVDVRLNTRFAELKQALQPSEVADLIASQRQWLRGRDATCQLNTKLRQREDWYEHVAAFDSRAGCVRRITESRIAELNPIRYRIDLQTAVVRVTPQPSELTFTSGVVSPADATASTDFLLQSARSHRVGKHYFEIVIDEARAGRIVTTVDARISNGQRWNGTIREIRSRDWVLRTGPDSTRPTTGENRGAASVPKQVVGLAVDLDSGRIYVHRDGKWFANASPDSAQGSEFKREGSFTAEVKTGVRVAELEDTWILSVNFGHKPFEYKLPAGYRGFDWPDEPAAEGADPTAASTYPLMERIAGDTQVQWLLRYWEWVRSFPAGETPFDDPSGFRCGLGQSGPVWFLTGSGQANPVRRECEIPYGKVVLLPFVSVLVNGNSGASCPKLLDLLRPFGASVGGLYFKLNDAVIENPKPVRLSTGCFPLRDRSTGEVGLAAATGHWMFLQPLRKGTHFVEFGGRYTADGFSQDIGYVLHVR